MVAHLNAWLGTSLHIPSDAFVVCLNIILWTAQAALIFRMTRQVTGSALAACLATLFCGLNLPICLSDAPFSLEKPERTLAMIPLLFSVISVLEGHRWVALVSLAVATNLHGNPAIYLWPVIIFEDCLDAWRCPSRRFGTLARLAATTVLTLPILLAVSRHPLPTSAPDYVRVSLLIHTTWTKLTDIPSRWLFIIEGMILTFMAAWRQRQLKAVPVLVRALSLCYVMLATTWIASRLYVPGGFALWGLVVRMQLGVSLFIFDLIGQVLLAGWLAHEIEQGTELWLPFLATLISWSTMYDGILRLVGIGLGMCLFAGDKVKGRWLTLGAAAVPILHMCVPKAFQTLAQVLRLTGGLFSFSIFNPLIAIILLTCLAVGYGLKSRVQLSIGAAALVLVFAGIYRNWPMVHCGPRCIDEMRIGAWVRSNTPSGTVIIPSPIDLVDMEFATRSQRSLFVCNDYLENAIMFGRVATLMGQRLLTMGLQLNKIRISSDIEKEIKRADSALTPKQVIKIATEFPVRSYLLLPAERTWPASPVYKSGNLALYRIGSNTR